jgi:hypothetical protein
MASTRILRLAFGTALSLWISQAVGWTISYIAPIITLVLLAMPIPRPKPKFFVVVVLAMTLSIFGSFVFLPMLLHQKLVGLLLLCLALFHAFYVAAKGGPAVVSTLITIGLALTVAVGSVSVDALIAVAQGLFIGASAGAAVAILSHAVLPDREQPAAQIESADGHAATAAPPVDLAVARRNAFRSLTVVFPILFWFLLSAASASNMAVMIKVAAMGQEVSHMGARKAARSLIASTVVGGFAATLAWQVLSIWPSLTMYVLLIALAGLVFGRRIFEGDGPAADADTWQYAYLTMIVVLAPSVMDSNFGSSADAAFYGRLMMFAWATLYAVVAVYVFDALWPQRTHRRRGSE